MFNWHRTICGAFLAAALLSMLSQFARADELRFQTEPKTPDEFAKALWTQCIGKGRQVVLFPDRRTCTDRSDGQKLLVDLDPGKFDRDTPCSPSDLRMLPTGLIQSINELVKQNLGKPDEYTREIQKSGIRIIGGLFCSDELSLSDLTVAVPLVLDRGVFKYGVRARKLTVNGNLSFAGAYVYENFDLSDSKIGGTLFGNSSFMENVRLIDLNVLDYVRFNKSILLSYFNFIRVQSGRGVDLSESRISSLFMRQGQVLERLNLNSTEATCKFLIDGPDINELSAVGTGFGAVAPAPAAAQTSAPGTVARVWRGSFAHPEMLKVKAVENRIGALSHVQSADCTAPDARFAITGGAIRSICLQNFRWIEPDKDRRLPTVVSLNGVKVSEKMAINLSQLPEAQPASAPDRVLELVDTNIGSLYFDFKHQGPYVPSLDQINIDRVHASDSGCATYPVDAELPEPSSVVDWLKKNRIGSLQPYVAFIKAFENAGADATDIKVAKAGFAFNADLHTKWLELTDTFKRRTSSEIAGYIFSLQRPIDAIRLGIGYIGGLVADYGYRPYKSLIYIAVAVGIFYLLITRWLFVTHAKSEMREQLMPVGVSFIIDSMIPVYNLDPAHSKISGYYFPDGKPIDVATQRRLDRVLLGLRVTGVIAAVFLTAALKVFVLN